MTEAHIEEIPAALMAEPLNWLFAEHYRHRQLCQLIERVGNATVLLSDEAHEILAFLRHRLLGRSPWAFAILFALALLVKESGITTLGYALAFDAVQLLSPNRTRTIMCDKKANPN